MGINPSLFVFDYEYYEKTLVPLVRDLVAGRAVPAELHDVVARFASGHKRTKPFQMPARGYCLHLAAQPGGCFCLRADLGLEPDHYFYWPEHCFYRPVGPQDSACGLFAGMNRWAHTQEDFVSLFEALVAANCLGEEQFLSCDMYLWEYRLLDKTNQDSDPSWIWKCTEFLERSRPLWLALYRRGCHIGCGVDPAGVIGWLTPAEVRAMHEAIAVLPPPPFERPPDWSGPNYDAYMDYDRYDDMLRVAEWCKLAATTGSGLVGSYLLYPKYHSWARMRP